MQKFLSLLLHLKKKEVKKKSGRQAARISIVKWSRVKERQRARINHGGESVALSPQRRRGTAARYHNYRRLFVLSFGDILNTKWEGEAKFFSACMREYSKNSVTVMS